MLCVINKLRNAVFLTALFFGIISGAQAQDISKSIKLGSFASDINTKQFGFNRPDIIGIGKVGAGFETSFFGSSSFSFASGAEVTWQKLHQTWSASLTEVTTTEMETIYFGIPAILKYKFFGTSDDLNLYAKTGLISQIKIMEVNQQLYSNLAFEPNSFVLYWPMGLELELSNNLGFYPHFNFSLTPITDTRIRNDLDFVKDYSSSIGLDISYKLN